jgi:uncharacterized protein with von Willebrand factor type A (vWA) domain
MAINYSKWDGTQEWLFVDETDLLSEITDDIIYHGDVSAALRRLLRQGFLTKDGDNIMGLDDIVEAIRNKKEEIKERVDPLSIYEDVQNKLEEILDIEKQEIHKLKTLLENSNNKRQQEISNEALTLKELKLEFLGDDIPTQINSLNSYDFTSSKAEQLFNELKEEITQRLLERYLDSMQEAVNSMDEKSMTRIREALDAINAMIEKDLNHENIDQDFENFMDKYGDLFPSNPKNLTELLEFLVAQMAASQAMLNAMSEDQLRQFLKLQDSLLADMDLSWQLNRLSSNLAKILPEKFPAGSINFEKFQSDQLKGLNSLGKLSNLENILNQTYSSSALMDIDLDEIKRLLGDKAYQSIEKLKDLHSTLEKSGLVEKDGDSLKLTPKGLSKIASKALTELFSDLRKSMLDLHATTKLGFGSESSDILAPYEFGDQMDLNITETIKQAIFDKGPTIPVKLNEDNFIIVKKEESVRAATVIMLDLSLSMPMKDNFLPAKKVALALWSLISSKYPRDFVGIVGFAESAFQIKYNELPETTWNYAYGTNMAHGLAVSRHLLSNQVGNKQIIMITDGEPTAHLDATGQVFFHYPPIKETIDRTLLEVLRCTKSQIKINTFMLDSTIYLTNFIKTVTEINKGKAFFTTNENLGKYVLLDFMNNRKTTKRI